MPQLSPAAQAVLDAFNAEARPEPHHQREAIAAALRAAADQVAPVSEPPQRGEFSDLSVYQWAVDVHAYDDGYGYGDGTCSPNRNKRSLCQL